MGRILTVLAICAVFCSHAFASPSVPDGMGFLPSNDSSLPAAVRKAALSTFWIVLPSGNYLPPKDVFGVDLPIDKLIAGIEAVGTDRVRKHEKFVYIYQLKRCLEKPSKPCLLAEGVESGTGFITGDGFQMRTAHHVVRSSLAQGFGPHSKPLPIFIFGPNEDLLFAPDEIEVTIDSMGSRSSGALDEETQHKLQDVVSMRLSKKIADPIPAGANDSKPGDNVYLAGFVIPTSDRKSYGAVDASGFERTISKGHILTRQEAFKRAKDKFGAFPEEMLEEFLKFLIVSNADGGPRLSGAPTLNVNGEYIGIYNSGAPQNGIAEPLRFSYSTPVRSLLP